MPKNAKLYIGFTIALGLALLAGCLLFQWQFPDVPRFLSYLLLASVASTLKVRLPRVRGTVSVNFVFLLIGVAQLTLSETLVLGCVATIVQCIWNAKTRPRLIQVLFNVSVLVIGIAVAYRVAHNLTREGNLAGLLASAACLLFVANAGLVSLVVSLVETQPFEQVWRRCYLWIFPYYLVGATVAGVVAASSRVAGWRESLLVLPAMYMVFCFYRMFLRRQIVQERGPLQGERLPNAV